MEVLDHLEATQGDPIAIGTLKVTSHQAITAEVEVEGGVEAGAEAEISHPATEAHQAGKSCWRDCCQTRLKMTFAYPPRSPDEASMSMQDESMSSVRISFELWLSEGHLDLADIQRIKAVSPCRQARGRQGHSRSADK